MSAVLKKKKKKSPLSLSLMSDFSLLMCTAVFTYFHPSMWIPTGLLALFFLDKNTVYLYYRHLALITEGWEHKLRLLGLLMDW